MKRFIPILVLMALLLGACSGVPASSGGISPATSAPTTAEPTAPAAPGVETGVEPVEIPGGAVIELSDDGVTLDGQPLGETGQVYVAHDIVYYEAGHDFTYGEGGADDEHSAGEAAGHTVVHIAAPGTYVLRGSLSAGQIAVDLGDDAEDDPEAVVNLVLDGVDIRCTVAPAIIFYNVYECGDKDEASPDVDTSAAGANIYLADGSMNTVAGSYVARIYKSVELSEDGKTVVDSKKLHKYDGAVYSKMSMNVFGNNGVLNIDAENEGLDTELHLSLNGGVINIVSGNDGINTNEDGVSVTAINGGELNVTVDGSSGEGDGIDSNGWLVINGGTVRSFACATSQDFGLDSDMGTIINGGVVVATGNMADAVDGESGQDSLYFTLPRSAEPGGLTLKDAQGGEVMTIDAANGFSVLVASFPGLDGEYSLYDGDELLATAQPGAGPGRPGMPGGPGNWGGFGGPGGRDDNGGFGGRGDPGDFGDFGGQTPPELPEGGDMPEPPDDANRPQPPDNGGMPQPPEGN